MVVGCDQITAYRLFVEEIGAWWPLASVGCFGDGAVVALDGNRFVETGPGGETAVWGTIAESDAPRSLSFTWHPGREADVASSVRVSFTETSTDGVTLVTLEHAGWEHYPDPRATRDEYGSGWSGVLESYSAQVPRPTSTTDLWFVLSHTPGSDRAPEKVFSSPLFAQHIEFLTGLAAQGVLVGAGPLPDTAGAGMTVVHTTNLEGASAIIRAAQHDDGSVTSGLLDVRVRPWQVVMTGADAT